MARSVVNDWGARKTDTVYRADNTPAATTTVNTAVNTAANTAPAVPAYNDTYRQQMNDTYNAITNRQPFTYDVNSDALYQQYRDKYIQGGKMAMKDTMGQAAALTGGYGSSYGQAVGQQQYDAYLQNLNDVIPQLYDTAYQRYRDQGNDLEKQYAMLGELSADEYNKYRDQMSDYRYNQEWQAQQDAVAYSKKQDAYNKMYQLITTIGYKPTEKQLKAAGMTQKEANALLKAYQNRNGGGGGGGGYVPAASDDKDSEGEIDLEKKLAELEAADIQANRRAELYDPLNLSLRHGYQ